MNALIKRNLFQLGNSFNGDYANQVIEKVNDHALHLSVMTGEYRWHFHQHTDELFIVMDGQLKIETEDGQVHVLSRGDCMTIPAGMKHKTSAIGRSVNLTVEKGGEDTVFI